MAGSPGAAWDEELAGKLVADALETDTATERKGAA
jgi:hypothetical protein